MDMTYVLNWLQDNKIPKEQWGQWAIAFAVDRAATKLGYLGFDAPDGTSPGALEFVGMALRDGLK